LPDAKSVGGVSNQVVKVFICPAYTSIWQPGNIDMSSPLVDPSSDNYQSYSLNGNAMGSYSLNLATGANGAKQKLAAAFPTPNTYGSGGAQAGPYPFGKGSSQIEPLKLAQITSAGVALAELWSIGDADEVASSGLIKPGAALKPVHRTIRSFAYFDGHAATVRITGDGAYDQ
jgi:hypothetical protein